MARRTTSSADTGLPESKPVKSPVHAAGGSSLRRATAARSVRKPRADGTSTTSKEPISTEVPLTPAATGRRRRTGSNGKGAGAGTENFPPGGQLDLTVVGAVKRDLAEIARRSPDLAVSGFAATALALAREMDYDNSATSKSMCAKALVEALSLLRELSPPDTKRDGLDDLAARRAKRLNGGSAAAH